MVFFMLETGGKMTGACDQKVRALVQGPAGVGAVQERRLHPPRPRAEHALPIPLDSVQTVLVPASRRTRPSPRCRWRPPPPRLINTAVTVNTASVTLDWGEGGAFKLKMRELRRAFAEMDADGNGALTRDEFSLAITKQPSLREFLSWSMGVDHAGAMGDSMMESSGADAERETVLAFFRRYRHGPRRPPDVLRVLDVLPVARADQHSKKLARIQRRVRRGPF